MRPTCTSAFKFTGLAVIGFLSGPTWSQTPRAIAIGDSVDTVRQVLGVTTALVPANNSTPGSQALPQWDRGLMVFFDSSNRVYRIRLTPPFSSAVCGARLGDPRQAILELLGPPSRKFPSPTFPDRTSYVYECDSIMSVRYDFTANDRLSGIFILSGSIPVPPVVASATLPPARAPKASSRMPMRDRCVAKRFRCSSSDNTGRPSSFSQHASVRSSLASSAFRSTRLRPPLREPWSVRSPCRGAAAAACRRSPSSCCS